MDLCTKFYSIGVLKPIREMRDTRKETEKQHHRFFSSGNRTSIYGDEFGAANVEVWQQHRVPRLRQPSQGTAAITVASPDCDYRRESWLRQPSQITVLKHSKSRSNVQWRIHLRTSLMRFVVLDDFHTKKEHAFCISKTQLS